MTNKIEITYATNIFSIFNLENLEFKVARLNVRFRKLGCQPMVCTTLGSSEVRYPGKHWYDPDIYVKMYEVQISYPSFKIDGWKVVGTIDHVEGLVHGDNVPAHYRDSAPRCDHCHVERNRNTTVILQNEETQEYKQIGTNCLALYLGIDGAVAALMSDEKKLIAALYSEDEDAEERMRRGRAEFRLQSYLSFVAMSIRLAGWVSSTEAHNSYKVSTANHAISLMQDADNEKKETLPTEDDRKRAQDAIDWAKEIGSNESDYMLNIRSIARNEYCTNKSFGYAASILSAYSKAQKVQAEQDASPSRHFAAVGAKISLPVTCTFVSDGILTDYGWLYINSFVDASGNVIVWKSSTRADLGKFTLKATVKANDEYKGIKQTVVTRAKLTSIE